MRSEERSEEEEDFEYACSPLAAAKLTIMIAIAAMTVDSRDMFYSTACESYLRNWEDPKGSKLKDFPMTVYNGLCQRPQLSCCESRQ